MFQKALITPRDVLAHPDEPVTLEVELEHVILPFLDPPIAGVEISLEGVGRVRTDAGGRSKFDLGCLAPGTHRYRAVLAGDRWRADPAEALVTVAPHDAPIFITDIDGTIADVSRLGFLFRVNSRIPVVEGAREALQEISRKTAVVYLSARDHTYAAKTRDWLRRNEFPDGPLYVRRQRLWSATPRRHKIRRLNEFQPRFTNIRWGVGDLRSDMEAYAERGIPSILLGRGRHTGLPAGAVLAGSWKEILSIVTKDPRPNLPA